MSKFFSKIFQLTVIVLLCMLLLPGGAFADTTNGPDLRVFSIISSKVLSTAKDVRQIVYVIGGFGLIMFAVLAIFNKISFKHLMYICFSLWLLSVMTLFIDYFTGTNIDNTSQQRWGDHTTASTGGSNADETLPCTTTNCPSSGSDNGGNTSIGTSEINAKNQEDCEAKGGMWLSAMHTCQSLSGLDSAPTLASMGTNDTAEMRAAIQKCVKDGNKWDNQKNKCNKSFANTMKDIAKGAQQAASAVRSAANMFQSGKQTWKDIKRGAKDIPDAIGNIGTNGQGLGGLLNSVSRAANTVGSTASRVSSGANNTIQSGQNAVKYGADTYDTATGNQNTWNDKLKNSTGNDIAEAAKQAVKDKRKDVTDITNPTSNAANSGANAVNAAERLGDTLSNLDK